MGTTNRPRRFSPGQHQWTDTLLPFFNWFIREGGFESWWSSLKGTQAERDLHPFTWTYDPETETVRRVDRQLLGSVVEETDETFTKREALKHLLEREVDSALVELRVYATRSANRPALLQPYAMEAKALLSVSASHDGLSQFSFVQDLIELLKAEIQILYESDSNPVVNKKRRGIHQDNEDWIINKYREVRSANPEESEMASRVSVADSYLSKFNLAIDESTVRRFLGEKGYSVTRPD